MKYAVAALLAAMSLCCAQPASAATVKQTITFSAKDFFAYGAYPVPVDPVFGSFTITYDPSVEVQYVSSGVTLHGINIPLDPGYPLQLFNYPTLNQLSVSTHAGPVVPGEFSLGLLLGSGGGSLSYTTLQDPYYLAFTPDGYGQFYSSNVTFTVTTTPIPPALLLFLAAIAGLGLLAARRDRATELG